VFEPFFSFSQEEEAPCVDCDKPGKISPVEFNPKKLLQRLCSGGKCPTFEDTMALANGGVTNPQPVPFKKGFMAPHVGSI
jgi:hypothetical protein